jgi:hypothetical protein
METQTKLERDVRFLKLYAIATSLVCGVLLLTAFAQQARTTKFEEIDVERINIVEKDGKLRMVISNQARQHPGIVNGKPIPRQGPRPPGIIFFNHLGDEMGGLIYGENGGNGHFGSFTWDKVRGDQTIGFRHLESDNGMYSSGLEIWQQPNIPADVLREKLDSIQLLPDTAQRNAGFRGMREKGELMTQRIFLGKARDNASRLTLYDIRGRARLRMQVAADGSPQLEFLDEAGKVTLRLPDRMQ